MAKSRCSLSYHEAENSLINEFSTGVKSGIFGNAVLFPAPPISNDEFSLLIETFTAKLTAWKNGGIDQRGPFLDAKDALMVALDDYAAYVDGIADGNETTIVAGGFKATKTVKQPKPVPEIPTGIKLTAKGNGKIEAECARMDNAEFYGAVCSTGNESLNTIFNNGQFNITGLGTLNVLIDANKDRVKVFNGLTGGTNYYIQFFCGNGKGTTLLSEPVRIMATT